MPLSPRAVEIITQLAKARRGPYVFSGTRADGPLSNMTMTLIHSRAWPGCARLAPQSP